MNDMTIPLITNELDFLQSLVELSDVRVVEAGCGAAHLARELVSRHPTTEVVGIEVDERQLAKNLLLSGERQFLRKGQELVLAVALEALLSKERILEIYLNSVEWGEGVFGAEAAAQRYFKKPASKLSASATACISSARRAWFGATRPV